MSRIARGLLRHDPGPDSGVFGQLNYSLDPEHEEGLATFFNYLYNLGELPKSHGWSILGESFQLKEKRLTAHCCLLIRIPHENQKT